MRGHMCHKSCIDFGKRIIREEYIKNKSVIEVGSTDINGSLRSIVELFGPSEYIGVDIQNGPGTDRICSAENCIRKFGYNRFDVVICTELLEHVKNWRRVIHNLKSILKPDGRLIITTRSKGFPYHGYPFDFWRYEISDMKTIFCDFEIEILEYDQQAPGIFLLVKKPKSFIENAVFNLSLYSVILKRRSSILVLLTCWIIIKAQLNILKPLKSFSSRNVDYYIERIIYYNVHPIRIFKMLKKKLFSY